MHQPAPLVLRVIDTSAAQPFLQRRARTPFQYTAATSSALLETRYDTPAATLHHANVTLWQRIGPQGTHYAWCDPLPERITTATATEWPAEIQRACARHAVAATDLVPCSISQQLRYVRAVTDSTGTRCATVTVIHGTESTPENATEFCFLVIDHDPASSAATRSAVQMDIESTIACRRHDLPVPFVYAGLRPTAAQTTTPPSDESLLRQYVATNRSADDFWAVCSSAHGDATQRLVLAAALAQVDGSSGANEPFWLAMDDAQRDALAALKLPTQRSALTLPALPLANADRPITDVLRDRLRGQFRRVLLRESVLHGVYAAEDIHRIRVSLRKLNSLMDCGLAHYDAELFAQFRRGFRRMARFLGVLRDIDSFAEHVRRILGTATVPAEIDAAMSKIRTKALNELVALMTSERHGEFLRAFAVFVCDEPAAAEHSAPTRVVLQARLNELFATMVTPMATPAPKLDTDELHDIRIDAKKLRYTLEAFIDICTIPATPLLSQLERLQQRLGVIQDAATAHQLLVEAHLMSNTDAKRVLQALRAEAHAQRSQLGTLWHRLTGPEMRTMVAQLMTPVVEETT